MSGINLQITDLMNEVGVPPLIEEETKELQKMKESKQNFAETTTTKDQQKHRKIQFQKDDFSKDPHRVEAGKDPKKSKKTVEDLKPKPPPLFQRAITGTLSTIICAYNKIAVCTGCKISPPSHLIDSFAFYPPSPWKWYYLSYFNEEIGRRSFGNAKQCYGKQNLRIEPVTDSTDEGLLKRIEAFAERAQPFIVQSESKNYIAAVKIQAELSLEEEPSHKVILLANSNACDMGLSLNCYAGYIASYQHPDAYDLYTFDYSGYGLSTGKANEEAVYKDIEGVYDYIVTERKDPKLEVILLANSNACDMGLSLNCYAGYIASYQHPDAYDLYTFDYSGYGLSTGKANEEAVYKDIEGVYDYIVTERKDPKLEIILVGISIGTAVVTDLAAKNLPYVTGVVLIAPLTSAIRHVARHHPPKITSAYVDCFRTIDKVPLVNVPLLCIHGLNDEMMPPSNSAEIYAAAPFGVDPLFIPNRCHLGVLSSFRLGERIITFMEEDIEKWKAGFAKDKLNRTSHMKYEEFEYDKDTESDDKSDNLATTLTPTSTA
uniref:Serine aminopeptidase S33 domain-containing protein n=1 Tax=Panagrolaimus sp. ES5 TaxID=591445 RepID=A0AC34FK27_9BILA